jgi:citrate lyase beta subunit
MNHSLTPQSIDSLIGPLRAANKEFARAYPGISHGRQPAHTVYGGAHLFKADIARKMSETSLKFLEEYAPTPAALARGVLPEGAQFDEKLWSVVHARVTDKLKREALEDFRIDFEDGYGNRPDAEEDGHAEAAAMEIVKGMEQRSLPPFIGIRIKSFSEECFPRAVRSLDVFLTTLLKKTGGKLPQNFVVTLPKITATEQSRTLSKLLGQIEENCGMASGSIQMELMVETPQSILSTRGTSPLREFVEAAGGRVRGAHFGTYDYTAGVNITAAYQMMDNPVCDFAKHVMQVSLAGTPVMLSDGATNVMPVGPHKGELSAQQKRENEQVVQRAWRLSYGHIRHSLATGYYQGWDLHPGQLVVRYAALYSFFLEGIDAATARLKAFMEKAAKATLLGDVFDDAATGQGLLNYFLRGMACGAVTEAEALNTGLTLAEIQTRSFLKILEGRKKL